jgi:capsular exopolysaccharide synthesis family protein
MDLDLRRRTLSKQLGHRNDRRGFTSYMSDKITSIDGLISRSTLHDNLDIIYAGPQPPNPAEMLMSEKLDKMMEELKTRYDYVIIDAVPSMMIADAQIINRLADLTIYVVREGLLDRRQLPDIERLYTSGKFSNMSIILNGSSSNNGYGYRHGYGYQYGYGYHYGHSEDGEQKSKKKSLLDRFKKK